MNFGLEAVADLGVRACHVVGDSKLVVCQVNGDWATRHPKMKALHRVARRRLDAMDGSTVVSHVPRGANGHADALANYAMDSGSRGAVSVLKS